MSYEKPNYTQVPNALFDIHMPEMGNAELRVVLAIARNTFGWQKGSTNLSITQLESLTGLSRQGVQNGVNDALDRGVLERISVGQSFEYRLIIKAETMQRSSMEPCNVVAQSEKPSMQRSSTELCNVVARSAMQRSSTIKRNNSSKERKKKIAREQLVVQSDDSHAAQPPLLVAEEPAQSPIPVKATALPPRSGAPPKIRAVRQGGEMVRFESALEMPTLPKAFEPTAQPSPSEPKRIFQEYFQRKDLAAVQWRMVDSTVTDLMLWRRVCQRWAEVYGEEWRKFGLLDWYKAGIPGEQGNERKEQNDGKRTGAKSTAGNFGESRKSAEEQYPQYAKYGA